MSSRPERIKLGLERSRIVGVEMGRVGKNANVNSVRRQDGEKVVVWGHDQLANVFGNGCFDDLCDR